MSEDNEPRVEVTRTYYRNEHGEMRERVTLGSRVLSDGPSQVVFIDTSRWRPYPWEGKMVKQ
jgi:hypothetical protein